MKLPPLSFSRRQPPQQAAPKLSDELKQHMWCSPAITGAAYTIHAVWPLATIAFTSACKLVAARVISLALLSFGADALGCAAAAPLRDSTKIRMKKLRFMAIPYLFNSSSI